MKKRSFLFLSILAGLGCLSMSACDMSSFGNSNNTSFPGSSVAVSNISLEESITIGVGETRVLTPYILPTNATNTQLYWASSNSSVATVNNGAVTGVAFGSAYVTVTSVENSNISATCLVNVSNSSTTISVTSVLLDRDSISLTIGQTSSLIATVYPTNATNKKLNWATSNSSVATVDYSGAVTARGSGTANITATSAENNKIFASCTINVSSSSTVISVTSVSVSPSSLELTVGASSSLTATVYPTNATNKAVTWSSSNTSIATVSSSGLVNAKAAGSVTITVKTSDGNKTATCSVTVKQGSVAVTSVSLNKTSLSLTVGNASTLTATVYPTNATNKNVSWSSSNTSVATVSSSGLVTAKAAGNATITVKTEDGNKTATCAVTVSQSTVSVTSVAVSPTSLSLNVGETSTLTATVYPSNATNKSVSWTSSNSTVASVDNSGVVTARATGSATITVKTLDGNKTATCSVTVSQSSVAVTSVSLNKTSLNLTVGNTSTLTATVYPSNATNKNVTWSSSNTSAATVSSSGLVTAKAAGSATITVKTVDGNKTATCSVTVTSSSTTGSSQTVLIYMCGADLESDNQLATSDLQEILKVSNQPEDVNIVIETGGASSWASTYGINASKLQRHHVRNKSLITDQSLTYASMGKTTTLQSFLEYGLTNYPADKVGLILWNHGGGMSGVCFDEKSNNDSLLDYEVTNAVSAALTNCGMAGQKLEWIGYDACLMQVQDIAEFNSPYFNYMVASEESEAGYGWDYDNWVDDLYAKKPTETVLKAICDSFIADNGGVNSSYNDQTLSYLNLSYASAYKTAWENMAITSSNKSSFKSLVKSAKKYADDYFDYYGLVDAKDFINKLANSSTFNPGSSYTSAVISAHTNLVTYSTCGKGAGNSYGLCMFYAVSYSTSYYDYSSSTTHFTNWLAVCNI